MKRPRLAVPLVVILSSGAAHAATITVNSLADNVTVDGQVTLREAIVAANTDTSVDGSVAGSGADTIVFAVGPGAILLNGTQLPTVGDDLTITGPGPGPDRLALDGGQASRLLEVSAVTSLAVFGLTIRNGRVMGGDGGGILNAGVLALDNCAFSGNAVTGNGGAVRSTGTLRIGDSTFSGNSAQNGGAVYSSGDLLLYNSTLNGNFTGGIAPFVGGGGALVSSGLADIINSTFTANSATNGGGLLSTGGTLLIANCTVTGNTATVAGGGIRSSVVAVTLEATIVAENRVGTTAQDVAAAADGISHDNVIGVGTGLTGISDGARGNRIGIAASPLDPGLGPLQNNGGPTFTRAVLPGSPALDGVAFDTSTCFGSDQRRIPRPLDGDGDGVALCDVGAYEAFRVAAAGVSFHAITPCRVVDTRSLTPPALAANATRFVPLAARCGISPNTKAIAFNVTVVGPTHAGDLRLYPAGAAAPPASTINFAAGRARANSALIPLGAGAQIAVQCDMPPGLFATTHLVLDVYGYFE